jgi:hypothetical protein
VLVSMQRKESVAVAANHAALDFIWRAGWSISGAVEDPWGNGMRWLVRSRGACRGSDLFYIPLSSDKGGLGCLWFRLRGWYI